MRGSIDITVVYTLNVDSPYSPHLLPDNSAELFDLNPEGSKTRTVLVSPLDKKYSMPSHFRGRITPISSSCETNYHRL
jgi:hypothetical protein